MRLPISLATLLISISLTTQTGCAVFNPAAPPPETMDPEEQIYGASFDSIWLATQKAMAYYPMRVNNMDLKILETDAIKGDRYWSPPHIQKRRTGEEYKIIVRIIEGQLDGRPAQKVSVSKVIHRVQDFFSKKQQVASTGLEEKALLYRIERELIIERALERVQKRSNNGF